MVRRISHKIAERLYRQIYHLSNPLKIKLFYFFILFFGFSYSVLIIPGFGIISIAVLLVSIIPGFGIISTTISASSKKSIKKKFIIYISNIFLYTRDYKIFLLSLMMALIERCPKAWHMLIERHFLAILYGVNHNLGVARKMKWCKGEYIIFLATLK